MLSSFYLTFGAVAEISVDYTIGGYQRKGELDYDLLAKLIMVLTRGPSAVTEAPPKEGAGASHTIMCKFNS